MRGSLSSSLNSFGRRLQLLIKRVDNIIMIENFLTNCKKDLI